jgi:hypothetical protein
MQIEDLAVIVLDLNLGVPWPQDLIPEKPQWFVGRKWRVEYVFSVPGLTLEALALGNEVRGVWRYEVIAEEKDPASGEDLVTLRIAPERRGAAGYHFLATYRRRDLALLKARRFEGDHERPFELCRLPPLEQTVSRSEDGKSYERIFVQKPPSVPPPEPEEEALAGAEELIEE